MFPELLVSVEQGMIDTCRHWLEETHGLFLLSLPELAVWHNFIILKCHSIFSKTLPAMENKMVKV